jgi:hypothetical protein
MMTHDTSELLRRALEEGNYMTGKPLRWGKPWSRKDRTQLAGLASVARKRGLTVSEALREAVRDYVARHA